MRALSAASGLLALLVALSFAGRFWPPGDALAVLRPHLVLGLAVFGGLTLWWGARRTGALALGVALITALPMAALFMPNRPPDPAPYLLYQKNLLAKAWPRAPLAREIIASGAQIVTLQEVSAHNQRYMRALFEQYPIRLICPFQGVMSVAILTAFEPVPGTQSCGEADGLALMQVRLPEGETLWLASLHLHWPWPYGQPDQLKAILPRLEALDGPVLIAGDFNMVPWGGAVQRIMQATNTRLSGPSRITFSRLSPALPLAIDHILLPHGAQGHITRKPLHGSDHNGLLARFAL